MVISGFLWRLQRVGREGGQLVVAPTASRTILTTAAGYSHVPSPPPLQPATAMPRIAAVGISVYRKAMVSGPYAVGTQSRRSVSRRPLAHDIAVLGLDEHSDLGMAFIQYLQRWNRAHLMHGDWVGSRR